MPKVLLRRLKVLASQVDESVEWVLNQALDLGLVELERRLLK
jgi:predicted transcriptional regulator